MGAKRKGIGVLGFRVWGLRALRPKGFKSASGFGVWGSLNPKP